MIAPITAVVASPDDRMPAHRKIAVSRPSRMTARKATIATATVLVSSARSISPCRWALMWRAFVAIQKIIQVISATASSDVMPANASAASSLSSSLTKVIARPERHRERDRRAHADPQALQRVAVARLHEVGDEDGHDEGCFEALAQADQETGEHAITPRCWLGEPK